MGLKKFDSYDDYYKVQKYTVRKKGRRVFFTDLEIKACVNWMQERKVNNPKGICHGARNGQEADLFKRYMRADVIGTDLFPFSGAERLGISESEVVEWDFSKVNPDWVGNFDFVYTNSLDHAQDPIATMKVWMDQLKPSGHAFIQWPPNKDPRRCKGGDCFRGDLYTYICIGNSVGGVVDLLYIDTLPQRRNMYRRKALEVVVVVVGKRHLGKNRPYWKGI